MTEHHGKWAVAITNNKAKRRNERLARDQIAEAETTKKAEASLYVSRISTSPLHIER